MRPLQQELVGAAAAACSSVSPAGELAMMRALPTPPTPPPGPQHEFGWRMHCSRTPRLPTELCGPHRPAASSQQQRSHLPVPMATGGAQHVLVVKRG
jgi:hypothetical protein